MRIWIVGSGEYSDYGIEAIYDSAEKAAHHGEHEFNRRLASVVRAKVAGEPSTYPMDTLDRGFAVWKEGRYIIDEWEVE